MPTSWMENIKPASSLIVKPRCGGQDNALLIWLASAVMRWRLRTKQSDMARVIIEVGGERHVLRLTHRVKVHTDRCDKCSLLTHCSNGVECMARYFTDNLYAHFELEKKGE